MGTIEFCVVSIDCMAGDGQSNDCRSNVAGSNSLSDCHRNVEL